MAFSAPYMCNICCNHENRSLFFQPPFLKKWHYLDLICSLHVVTMTTGLSYSNRSCLKKWHFLDLVCAYKFEFCTKIRMHPARTRFARPGGVHNKGISCISGTGPIFIPNIVKSLLSVLFCGLK